MFCFRVRKRLYDYAEGSLSQNENLKIKGHLERCSSCRREYQKISVVLGSVSRKKAPEMDEGFWNEFQAKLDEKLSASLKKPKPVAEFELGSRPRLSLKPAFALAVVLILLIGIASYISKIPPFGTDLRLARADREIVDELILCEELEQVPSFLLNDETYFEEEIELLYKLDPAFTL